MYCKIQHLKDKQLLTKALVAYSDIILELVAHKPVTYKDECKQLCQNGLGVIVFVAFLVIPQILYSRRLSMQTVYTITLWAYYLNPLRKC